MVIRYPVFLVLTFLFGLVFGQTNFLVQSSSTMLPGLSRSFCHATNGMFVAFGLPSMGAGSVSVGTLSSSGAYTQVLSLTSGTATMFGLDVACPGDLNADGVEDLFILASNSFFTVLLQNDTGLAEDMRDQHNAANDGPLGGEYPANAVSIAALDITGDGQPEVFIGVPSDAGNRLFVAGFEDNAFMGTTPSFLINSFDNFDPGIIVAPRASNFGSALAGVPCLVSGTPRLLAVGAPAAGGGGAVHLLPLNLGLPPTIGTPSTFLPANSTNSFGRSLSSATLDINGDGNPDLLVGSDSMTTGRVHILSFSSVSTAAQTLFDNSFFVPALSATSRIGGFVGAVDFNNDMVPDIIAGATGNNQIYGLAFALCGDGSRTSLETCDDGDIMAGDGCNSTCQFEIGWSCSTTLFEISTCNNICGDGFIVGPEECDDVGTVNDDGCSNVCTNETGFLCMGEPSVCNTICGDGILTSVEDCDDGNFIAGDGCNPTCQVEIGWMCGLSMPGQSSCIPECGDGRVVGPEPCDDANNIAQDGCSGCVLIPGFICTGEPSVCVTSCGDGIQAGAEECDDGNLVDDDGCSANCFDELSSSSSPITRAGIVGIIVAAVVIVCIIIACIVLFVSLFLYKRPSMSEAPRIEILLSKEIPVLTDVKIGETIGAGEFGDVYKGSWQGTEVALKSLKGDNIEEFANELKIMTDLSHGHVLHFFGIFVHGEDNFMVTEFMDKGDLLTLLHKEVELPGKDLTKFAIQIASGMSHLHSKRIIHRDLACRNVLVSGKEGSYKAKVADFGLSRIIENFYESQSRKIPVRWTAPEAIQTLRFTQKSDVWSYGVVLWEIYSRGQVPYPGMSNAEILEKIPLGERMVSPLATPVTAAQVMYHCWEEDPEQRPDFTQISEEIAKALEDEVPQAQILQKRESFMVPQVYRQVPTDKNNSSYFGSSSLPANSQEEQKLREEISLLKQQVESSEKYFDWYQKKKEEAEQLKKEVAHLKQQLQAKN